MLTTVSFGVNALSTAKGDNFKCNYAIKKKKKEVRRAQTAGKKKGQQG